MQRPPSKRRKISNYDQQAQWEEEEHRDTAEDWPSTFAHEVEHLEEAQLAQPAARGIGDRRILLPRQDTSMSNAMTTAAMAGSSADSASMASIASTSEAILSSAAATGDPASSEVPNSEPTATPTSVSPALSVLLSASLSLQVSLPISEIASVATGVPVSVVSGVLSDVSGLLAPSEASSTPSDTPSAPSSSSPNVTSSVPSTSSGNDTTSSSGNDTASIISTPPMTNTSGENTTTTNLLPASTSPGFLTSSFSRNSTTTASETPSSSVSDSASLTESTESVLAFIATLSQGDVTTLSRSADAYTTVLDGSTLTVSAAGTTSTSMSQASSITDSIASSGSASSTDSLSSSGQPTTTSRATTDGESSIASQYTLTSNAAPTSTEPASNSNSNNSSTPPAGTIAGGVVGGAAGLAVVVLIAMLAVRWYRRQGLAKHQALPQGPGNSPDPNAASSSGPGMAERAGLAPLVAAVPALFRNQNRAADDDEVPQRGFTRVAGRKLPSAFSGGAVTQPSSEAPINRGDADLSGTSFYRDSTGFYGGDSLGESPPSPTGSFPLRSNSYEHMTISPGPRRIPRLHSGGPYNLAAGQSPGPSSPQAPPALTRSDAPFLLDPNRNSRFSEGL